MATMNATTAKEPFSELPPRKLDALIAERVFGWWDIKPAAHAAGGFGSDWRGKPKGHRRAADEETIPQYSTDPNETMEVVVVVAAELPGSVCFTLYALFPSSDVPAWECKFEEPLSGRVFGTADANTPGRAVCLAALAAIEAASA